MLNIFLLKFLSWDCLLAFIAPINSLVLITTDWFRPVLDMGSDITSNLSCWTQCSTRRFVASDILRYASKHNQTISATWHWPPCFSWWIIRYATHAGVGGCCWDGVVLSQPLRACVDMCNPCLAEGSSSITAALQLIAYCLCPRLEDWRNRKWIYLHKYLSKDECESICESSYVVYLCLSQERNWLKAFMYTFLVAGFTALRRRK